MPTPKEYDVVVLGSGSGALIAEAAARKGLKVALIDKGPLGGTCTNWGCIPTKMLIASADRILEARDAARIGVTLEVRAIDFAAIMARMRKERAGTRAQMRHGLEHSANLDYYEGEGAFVDERALRCGDEHVRGRNTFIVVGARPLIPPIEGLEAVPFLTNESVLDLQERPESMVIVGGGYVACEFAHFFAAVGTRVTILQRNSRLVPEEEPEVSAVLLRKMQERMRILTDTEVTAAKTEGEVVTVTARNRFTGQTTSYSGQHLLIASGRRSNADSLYLSATSIATDARGYIQVDKYLQTAAPGIWAFGDVLGKAMFKHVANRQALFAWHNSQAGRKQVAFDSSAVPHAVFSYPQIASVGLTEAQARESHKVLVGRTAYTDTAMGMALREEDSFAKAIVEAGTGRILGFHGIGSNAAVLVQEVVNAMANGGTVATVTNGMHIHPALAEVVERALEGAQVV